MTEATAVRAIGLLQPLAWLGRGARDLAANPAASLFYGAAMAVAGAIILLAVAQLPYLFTAAISGFLLVGPMLATGLYDVSRRRERGESARLFGRKCDLVTAMQASIAAVAENSLPLALWATLIMILGMLGFATALLGFVVIMPLLGHASWHAYRDLVAA
jgi:uncharacterized membrane protein